MDDDEAVADDQNDEWYEWMEEKIRTALSQIANMEDPVPKAISTAILHAWIIQSFESIGCEIVDEGPMIQVRPCVPPKEPVG